MLAITLVIHVLPKSDLCSTDWHENESSCLAVSLDVTIVIATITVNGITLFVPLMSDLDVKHKS